MEFTRMQLRFSILIAKSELLWIKVTRNPGSHPTTSFLQDSMLGNSWLRNVNFDNGDSWVMFLKKTLFPNLKISGVN